MMPKGSSGGVAGLMRVQCSFPRTLRTKSTGSMGPDGSFQILGAPFESPSNKDHSILGSVLGTPMYGSLHMP